MKLPASLLIVLVVLSPTAFATTYHLSGNLTSSQIYRYGSPVPQVDVVGSSMNRVTGTLDITGNSYTMDLTFSSPDYLLGTSLGDFLLDADEIHYSVSGTLGNTSNYDSGGFSEYYYEEFTELSWVPQHTSAQQAGQASAERLVSGDVFNGSGFAVIDIDRIELGGTSILTEYVYPDYTQAGTPTIYETITTFDPDQFLTIQLAREYDFLIDYVQMDQTFQVSIQPVPLPASLWLFAAALVGLVYQGKSRR